MDYTRTQRLTDTMVMGAACDALMVDGLPDIEDRLNTALAAQIPPAGSDRLHHSRQGRRWWQHPRAVPSTG